MSAAAEPETLGNYVIDVELGRGAFGVVYRGHHAERPDRPVALKVIEGRGDLDRSMLEPAILSQLNHPCIVGIEDYFRAGDRLVLAPEFVEGEDLKVLLDRGETFSQAQVHDFLTQMAGALAAAHARQIIHRDIKPSNVLVVRDGGRLRFVLTDFGIGRQAEGIQDRKHTGGTFLFMAPEQLRGRPGPQSDLWALGVVAYRMVTGRLPFPGPTLPELAQQIMYGNAAPPSQVCGEPVDPDLEKIISRLLDKSLQERVASAEELLRLLGFHGKPSDVLSKTTVVRQDKRASDTLDRKLGRAINWRKWLLGVVLALYLLPSGLINTAMMLAGLWLFFRVQTDDRWQRGQRVAAMVAVFALLAASSAIRIVIGEWSLYFSLMFNVSRSISTQVALDRLGRLLGLGGEATMGLLVAASVATILSYFVLPPAAAAVYVRLRRLQREKTLRDATLEGATGSDRYLEMLRSTLDYRFADVGFHLKYAEALAARGRHAEAAVEARLILVQDRYNFNGNLLLANSYYTLGLYEDCAAVCDAYLTVSGFCFEFAELRHQCRGRGEP